jgi:exopolysaccharide biosynthesis polyprenyl glycosylphosphotransferase
MFRRFSINFALFSMFLDTLLVCLSLGLASHLRPLLSFLPFAARYPEFVPMPPPVYLLIIIEWILIFLLFSVYDGKRNLREVDEFISVTMATLMAAAVSAGTLYLSYRWISRLLFFTFIVLAYLFLLFWRGIARLLFRLGKIPFSGKRQVLIIGAGENGMQLKEQISQNPQSGLTVAGFLDDASEANGTVLGKINDFRAMIIQHRIEDVVIALPQSAYQQTNHLIGDLHSIPIRLWVIPDYFRLALYKAAVEEFAGIPLLDLRAPALNDYQLLVKRVFDFIMTIFLLPLAAPLVGLAALAVWLEDRSVIFLKQSRVGENGRIFQMIKFRTMRPGAEDEPPLFDHTDENGNLIHKTAGDLRVTRVGRFLRRTSMDELPQLFNVLKGEMSLVGPRPELPYLVEKYEPWQRKRFTVPQGMTGWWQIHGRSDKPMHLNIQDDIYYIQHYSLFLDIYILIKTIGTVILGKGAY